MDGSATRVAYEFGEFQVDATQRLLRSRADGQPLPLTSKAFETLELMPLSKDALSALPVMYSAATVYAWSGAHDEAVTLLERLYTTTPAFSPAALARDPIFTIPLAENPRYRALSERIEAQLRETKL